MKPSSANNVTAPVQISVDHTSAFELKKHIRSTIVIESI